MHWFKSITDNLMLEPIPSKVHNQDQEKCWFTQDESMDLWVEREIDMDEANNKHPLNVSGTFTSQHDWILSLLSDRNPLHYLCIAA